MFKQPSGNRTRTQEKWLDIISNWNFTFDGESAFFKPGSIGLHWIEDLQNRFFWLDTDACQLYFIEDKMQERLIPLKI